MPKNLRKNTKVDMSLIDLLPSVHYSDEMEAAVLGACLREPKAFGKILKLIEPEHFFRPANQAIMETMREMWSDGKPIDILTVHAEVYAAGRIGVFSGMSPAYYIMQLTNDVLNDAHIEHHALYVRQYFAKRELLTIQMEAGASNDDTVEKALEIQKRLDKVLSVKTSDDWMDMSAVMLRLQKHMDSVRGKVLLGMPTGFPSLDQLTSGFLGGQLIVVGARPSVGKTAFAAALTVNAAQRGNHVGVVNMEMPDIQIGARLLSYGSDIEFWRIYRSKTNDEQEMRLYNAFADLGALPIWISDTTSNTASDIRAKAYKLKNRGCLNMLIIDYLQLIEGEGKAGENREREVAKLSRALKLLAMELDIPVIILVQLNRDSDKAPNKIPRMSNIRESGAIEQDADIVILVHRPWKSGILVDENGNSTERQAMLIIEKNRNGECATLEIGFEPETMKFYEGDRHPASSNQFPITPF